MGNVRTASSFLGNFVAMDRFTGPRAFCVNQFYLNNSSLIIMRRLFRVEYKLHVINQCPSAVLLKIWVKKFDGPRISRSKDNVQRVSASVKRDSDLSTHKRSAELRISRTILRRILKLDLNLHPYKIQ